jgi:ABC-2 type transport system permease protein
MIVPSRSDLALLGRWVAARVRLTLRNPRALMFTFVFPLILVTMFSALNGDQRVAAMGDAGGKVTFAQFYTPSIGIFGLAAACYTGVAFGIAGARDAGLLKRVRGTPLPMSIYLGAWLTGAALTGIAAVVLLCAVAVPAFGVHVYARMLPAALVTVVLGAASLAALGLAVASLVRTADQAMPLAQLTLLPLSFISGIFYPLEGAPLWVVDVAHAFPLFHIVNAFDACFVPQSAGGGWAGGDLAAIAAWGLLGLAVAVRRLRGEPVGVETRVVRPALRQGWLPARGAGSGRLRGHRPDRDQVGHDQHGDDPRGDAGARAGGGPDSTRPAQGEPGGDRGDDDQQRSQVGDGVADPDPRGVGVGDALLVGDPLGPDAHHHERR